MDEARYARAKEIFLSALERPTEERQTFAREECAADDELLVVVQGMLGVDSSEEEFMNEPLNPTNLLDVIHAPPEIPGFHLLRKIGSGGMGDVWLAEQTDPVRRRVAVKIIRRGMDTELVVARFEAERQALAMMNHQNVAKVFDAGATADGRPYFAMEHVQGVPINEHCDRHRLSNRERLELFQRVCRGVQHAHQKGIIHRDLKPNNVLVQVQGGERVPKIIDFGVAKATQQRLTERTIYTELGQMIGTPEYMSPEQAEMTAEDVDTRTDVYSLGVLLYELLVGELPFESEELRQAGFDEIRRRIREQEPSKPSQRVNTARDGSTAAAERRRTDSLTLRRQLRGDLDWVVMKALEKDRTRRYDSPAELAADLGRHLSHNPVLARPPSLSYLARKFVRRHRAGVGVSVLLLAVLLVFTTTTTVQARRIAVEAETSEQVVSFLTGLFEVSDPSEARGGTITVREILDKGAREIESELADQPLVQARLMETIGNVYRNLGLHDQAQPLLEGSHERYQQLFGRIDLRTLASRTAVGALYNGQGRYEEAESLLVENQGALRKVVGEDHPYTLKNASTLANVYLAQGRHAEAEAVYLETIEIQKRVLGEEHLDTRQSVNNLAGVYQRQGRLDEAEQLHFENLETLERTAGRDHPLSLMSMSNLAGVYCQQDRSAEAEFLFLETIEIKKRVLGEEHKSTLASICDLAAVYSESNQLDKAVSLYLESRESLQRTLGEGHPDTLKATGNLALLYVRQRRSAEAEPLAREVLESKCRVLGEEHPSTLWSMTLLATINGDLGRLDQGVSLLREVAEIKRRELGPGHAETLESLRNVGIMAAVGGDLETSLEAFGEAVENGFSQADWLASERNLESLRGPEFDAIVERARQNAAAAQGGEPR